MSISDDTIFAQQRAFFRRNKSGCAFAAYAAKDMAKFGWQQVICPISASEIDSSIQSAISDPGISTLSLIFPDAGNLDGLNALMNEVRHGNLMNALPNQIWEGLVLFRARVKVASDLSWVSGFGPFDFFPLTRQAPATELTLRVKERPNYDWTFKDTPPGIIHLADMCMRGMSDKNLWKLWGNSFLRTKRLLGHAPNEASAAKTTFAIPIPLFTGTSP